jgi:hypothetical protein
VRALWRTRGLMLAKPVAVMAVEPRELGGKPVAQGRHAEFWLLALHLQPPPTNLVLIYMVSRTIG